MVLDGAMNGTAFPACVEQVLVPTLCPATSSSCITWRVNIALASEALSRPAAASLRRLPAYSPDFNPIEQAFSKLEALLRIAAVRTVPDSRTAIAEAFPFFLNENASNTFKLQVMSRCKQTIF